MVKPLFLLFAGAAIALALVRLFPVWREYDLSRQDLPTLLKSETRHQYDEQFLKHLGKRLNAAERFSEALPVLARAVSITPEDAELRDEWAKAQMGTGHVAEAYSQLKEFVAANPQASEPPFLLGKFYITQQAYGLARKNLEASLQRNPKNGEAWSLLAHCRIKMADNGGALEALQKAIALRPGIAEDYLQSGVLHGASAPDLANKDFQQSIRLAPRNPVVHREYSRFLLNQSRVSEALPEARRAVELDSSDAFAQILLGRCLLAVKQPKEAIPCFQKAATLLPTDPNPAEGLRRAYRQVDDPANAGLWDKRFTALRDNAEAKRKWEQATLAHPEDRNAHARYASYLCAEDDVNGCARQYALALKTTPDNPRTLLAVARGLNDAGFAHDALPLARKARQNTAMNPESFAVLGDILVNLGRLHEAAINYEQVRDWHTDQIAAYSQKIQAAGARLAVSKAPSEIALREALQVSDPESKHRFLLESLTSDPENTRALRELLKLQFGLGKQSEATETAKRLIALSPEDGLAHALFCLLYMKQISDRPLSNEEIKAIRQHLQIAEADSSVAGTVFYVRGTLWLRQKNPVLAIEALEKARQLDPTAVGVYTLLAQAYKAKGDLEHAQKAMTEFQRLTQQ